MIKYNGNFVLAVAVKFVDFFLTEDGVWVTWSVWGDCSVTCGGGLQYRNRTCDGPRYGGADCEGVDEQQRECGTDPCPSKFKFNQNITILH